MTTSAALEETTSSSEAPGTIDLSAETVPTSCAEVRGVIGYTAVLERTFYAVAQERTMCWAEPGLIDCSAGVAQITSGVAAGLTFFAVGAATTFSTATEVEMYFAAVAGTTGRTGALASTTAGRRRRCGAD